MHDVCPLPTQIMIAVPAYTGQVTCATQSAILDAVFMLQGMGIAATVRQRAGDCYIDLARNALAAEFLASDASHLLFIDADVGFPAEALTRLVVAQKPFIAGLYPKKSLEPAWPVEFDTDYIASDPETGLVEAAGVPTGFLLLHRSVFEVMHPSMQSYVDHNGESRHAYFQCEIHGGRWWGEDFTFCRRWRALGGRIWFAPSLVLQHVGTHTYQQGSYRDWFLQRVPQEV